MTARLGSAITGKIIERLAGPQGVNANLAALAAETAIPTPALGEAQTRAQNVAAELAERSAGAKYPAFSVYCEKLVNSLTEKFRSFSGSAQMSIEVRHSQDRLDGLQDSLELLADAATAALDASRGDWGDGMYYAGGYQVSFGAVKHGGRNFIQTAKIVFEIGISRS